MRTNALLTLLDREAHTLTGENLHEAAALMWEAAARLRLLVDRLRKANLSADMED